MGTDSNKEPGEPPTPIDYSPDSGATNPEHAAQDESEQMQTDRHSYTPNATFIDDYIEAKSNRWTSLNEANRQLEADGDDDPKTSQYNADNNNDIQIWGKQIGLTTHEIERAAYIFNQIESNCKRRQTLEAAQLAAITIAANEGRSDSNTQPRSIRPQITVPDDAPIEKTPTMCDTYQHIRDTLGVAAEQVSAVRTHIQKQM
jgi:hypothetical protein